VEGGLLDDVQLTAVFFPGIVRITPSSGTKVSATGWSVPMDSLVYT